MDKNQLLICEIANILEITELEILQKSYKHWHRVEGNEKALESLYGQIITNKTECPFWVRDYCRRVQLALDDNDVRVLWDLIKAV